MLAGYNYLHRHPGDLNAAVNSQLPVTQMAAFMWTCLLQEATHACLRDHAPLGVCMRAMRSLLGIPELQRWARAGIVFISDPASTQRRLLVLASIDEY